MMAAMAVPDRSSRPSGAGARAGPVARWFWMVGGLACVALGGLGAVVPGLPSTIFFICAAACFTRSSHRLERWVLGLPGVGPMVRDHRAGLGMPRRAKAVAIVSIVGFSGLAIGLSARPTLRIGIGVLAMIGIAVVAWGVPTRERVLSGDVRPRRRRPDPSRCGPRKGGWANRPFRRR